MIKLNLYVVHYKKLVARRANIDRLREVAKTAGADMDVRIHVVDNNQPDEINVNNIKNLVKLAPLKEEDKENTFYNTFVKKLSLEILSNIMHHFKALQMIVKAAVSDKDAYHIVLEDDVMYSDKVFVQIASLITHLKAVEWGVVFLGQPSDVSRPENNKLQLMNMGHERNTMLHCCESYMITPDMARDMVMQIFPIRFAYNIQFAYMLDKMEPEKRKAFKIFPNIFGDGSKMGNYNSSILPNNVLIFNATYKDIYLKLDRAGTVLSQEDSQLIEGQFANNPFKENPDFIYLEGLYHRKQGNLERCRECFEKTMRLYEQHLVPVNNSSSFLRNYIELHRFLQ